MYNMYIYIYIHVYLIITYFGLWTLWVKDIQVKLKLSPYTQKRKAPLEF